MVQSHCKLDRISFAIPTRGGHGQSSPALILKESNLECLIRPGATDKNIEELPFPTDSLLWFRACASPYHILQRGVVDVVVLERLYFCQCLESSFTAPPGLHPILYT
jgi:hypothetical protein